MRSVSQFEEAFREIKAGVIREINEGIPCEDIYSSLCTMFSGDIHDPSIFDIKRLTFRDKVILLNIIALGYPSSSDLLPLGRMIFDLVVAAIVNKRIADGNNHKPILSTLSPHNCVLDFHSQAGDSNFETEQFEGPGFTFFFLDKASSKYNQSFTVCPGKGIHTAPENMISSLNPIRYGVLQYLQFQQTNAENKSSKGKILVQIAHAKTQTVPYITIPPVIDNGKSINTPQGLQCLIHEVIEESLEMSTRLISESTSKMSRTASEATVVRELKDAGIMFLKSPKRKSTTPSSASPALKQDSSSHVLSVGAHK